jgi:hypothetical protein
MRAIASERESCVKRKFEFEFEFGIVGHCFLAEYPCSWAGIYVAEARRGFRKGRTGWSQGDKRRLNGWGDCDVGFAFYITTLIK